MYTYGSYSVHFPSTIHAIPNFKNNDLWEITVVSIPGTWAHLQKCNQKTTSEVGETPDKDFTLQNTHSGICKWWSCTSLYSNWNCRFLINSAISWVILHLEGMAKWVQFMPVVLSPIPSRGLQTSIPGKCMSHAVRGYNRQVKFRGISYSNHANNRILTYTNLLYSYNTYQMFVVNIKRFIIE